MVRQRLVHASQDSRVAIERGPVQVLIGSITQSTRVTKANDLVLPLDYLSWIDSTPDGILQGGGVDRRPQHAVRHRHAAPAREPHEHSLPQDVQLARRKEPIHLSDYVVENGRATSSPADDGYDLDILIGHLVCSPPIRYNRSTASMNIPETEVPPCVPTHRCDAGGHPAASRWADP